MPNSTAWETMDKIRIGRPIPNDDSPVTIGMVDADVIRLRNAPGTGTVSPYAATVQMATLTSDITITFPAATGTVVLEGAPMSGNLDMNGNLILNIGAAGTDFTAGGGLTLAAGLTVSAGGISAVGQTVTATTFTGNAATATLAAASTILANSRNINGVAFNGSANITVTAAADTLTGTQLATGIVTFGAAANDTVWTGQSWSLTGANSTDNTVLAVTNTSNAAAASHAYLDVSVGGTTSTGDPQLRLTIPGGTSWYAGVDNSASDAFIIGTGAAVGTNAFLQITTAGVIVVPAGTAASPSVGFSADTTTGLYRAAASTVGISAGGTSALTITIAAGFSKLDVPGTSTMQLSTTGTARVDVDVNGMYPDTTNVIPCGKSGNLWTAVWATNGTIQTSNADQKAILQAVTPSLAWENVKATDFFQYTYLPPEQTAGSDAAFDAELWGRKHWGFDAKVTPWASPDGETTSPLSVAAYVGASLQGYATETDARIARLEAALAAAGIAVN